MNKSDMYREHIEKTASRIKFKDLKKNQVNLTPDERAEVISRKAVWSGNSPAVWKSVGKDGKTTFVTHTHRAFNTAPTLKGAIGRFHSFIKSTASENVDDSIEKIAREQILHHASPVQDIKKFRRSEDTSGNNKGKVIFAAKDPAFAAAFGTRWYDGIARLNVETKTKEVPTEDNYVGSTLKYTDKVNVDAPCSMYRIKGDFKPLRYSNDLEQITNKNVEIISEEKFKNFKDMAKAYGLNLREVSEGHILNKLKDKKSSNFEKVAQEKIPELEEAFSDPIEKKVAYMIATSHEYKKPNVNAALSFVKNYKWELSKEKVKNLQGIEKPVNEEKVADMAKNMKYVEPFIVVNQLHGIRPQTPGKKILIDGHHRKKACEAQCREEVPVYKGTYTGKAELPKSELKTAYEIVNEAFEKIAFDKAKTYAVDFDGTIVENKFPKIGAINENMVNFMRKVKVKGGKVLIWTCRSGKYLTEAKKFLKDNDIPFDAINTNPEKDFGSPKIYADYYVDDRAINIKEITKTAHKIIDEAFEKIAAKKEGKSKTHVNKIVRSGTRQTMLHIAYTDKKGERTERMVEPYKLEGDSFWGYDPYKDGIRRFKVNQINHVKMTDVKFEPRWEIETHGYELPKKEESRGQLHLMDILRKDGDNNG